MRFYREVVNDAYWNWYVDLPEYDGPKSDLLMVMGADIMLDKILEYQKKDNIVEVEIETNPEAFACDININPHIHIIKVKEHNDDEYGSGATYEVHNNIGMQIENIWLCDVMLRLFGKFPNELYIKIK